MPGKPIISSNIPQDKLPGLEKALETPDHPNHKIILAKALERGWLSQAEEQSEPAISTTESRLRGTAQGLTAGFGEEASAVLQKGMIGAHNLVSSKTIPQPTYEEARNAIRSDNKAAEEANPGDYLGGQILGGVASTAPFGAAAGTLKGLALFGATNAAGTSEKQGMGLVTDTALGAGTGLALGAAGKGIIKGGQKITPAIKDAANVLAKRALGFTKGTIKALNNPATGRGGKEAARSAAQTVLDRGIIKATSSFEKIAEDVHALQKQAGKEMGEVLEASDAAGAKIINPTQIYQDVSKTLEKYTGRSAFSGELKRQAQEILEGLQASIPEDGGNITFQQAQKIKEDLGELVYKSGKMLPGKDLLRQTYMSVRDAIDDGIAKAELPEGITSEGFQIAKSNFAAASKAGRAIEDKVAGMEGNRILSLTDFVLGGGATFVNPGAAILGVLGKKLIEARGLQTGAQILNNAPKVIAPIGKPLVSGATRVGTAAATQGRK